MESLPDSVRDLLVAIDAPPRLVAHLTVGHHVAVELTDAFTLSWPDLHYDRQAVLLGAATHDIGKVVHPEELRGPGRQHEVMGGILLEQHGFTQEQSRFTRTHG